MTQARWIGAMAAAAALLAACGGRDDEDRNASAGNQQVSAEGKAEEGKISVKAPGFDLTFSLPKEMTGEAKVDKDSKVLYPGSTIAGVAVAAGPGGDDSGESEVEMRFATADPVEKVAAWYRDPGRAEGFRLTEARKEGDGYMITGVQKRDQHPFKVRLSAKGGGTDGRITVRHKD